MKSLVSICIPVYEMNGYGISMFRVLMNSISKQSYKSIQIVVSDHSKNKIFEDIYKQFDLNIKYLNYSDNYGNGPANTNNAIKNADGSIIKTIFQDDFFIDDEAIEKMVDCLKKSNGWIATGCMHTNTEGKVLERPHIPMWGGMGKDKTAASYNAIEQKIGCPSIIMFRKNSSLEFNERLTMLMDYDFYYQLGRLYGAPSILKEYLIGVRVWPGSITSRTGYNNNDKEKRIMVEMYDK
jgi:glycosyltransferase involved in cell wall biosynthesis